MRFVDHAIKLVAAGEAVAEQLGRRELLVGVVGLQDPAAAAQRHAVHRVVRVAQREHLAAGQRVDAGEDGGHHQAVGAHLHGVREPGRGQSPHLPWRHSARRGQQLATYLARPVDADAVEVALQAAVPQRVEIHHLVLLIPPHLPVHHLPVARGERHPRHYPRTQVRRVARPGPGGRGHAGHHQVEVAVARLLAGPEELDLAGVWVRQELEDVVDADPPLGLLAGDHLDGGGGRLGPGRPAVARGARPVALEAGAEFGQGAALEL